MMHLIAGLVIYSLLVLVRMKRSAAVVLVFIIAVNKELYDVVSYGGSGIEEACKDVLATMVGPVLGFIVTKEHR